MERFQNVSGLTFGTNGFHLEFKQMEQVQISGKGADKSGNDNSLEHQD